MTNKRITPLLIVVAEPAEKVTRMEESMEHGAEGWRLEERYALGWRRYSAGSRQRAENN